MKTANEQMDEIVKHMTDVVREFGSTYVYPKRVGAFCDYVRGGECSCIVGHVLFRMGWTIDELKSVEDQTPLSTKSSIWAERFTDSAIDLLSSAQRSQDFGREWGTVLFDAILRRRQLSELLALRLKLD